MLLVAEEETRVEAIVWLLRLINPFMSPHAEWGRNYGRGSGWNELLKLKQFSIIIFRNAPQYKRPWSTTYMCLEFYEILY